MLTIILLGVCGLVSGVIGGMGMGGGTLLIPMLALFFGVDAHACATINLLAFIPTAVIALIFHIKNKLVRKEGLLLIIVPALAASVGAYFLSKIVDTDILLRIFGGFLIAIAFCGFVNIFKKA